jgi:hypothetical protein
VSLVPARPWALVAALTRFANRLPPERNSQLASTVTRLTRSDRLVQHTMGELVSRGFAKPQGRNWAGGYALHRTWLSSHVRLIHFLTPPEQDALSAAALGLQACVASWSKKFEAEGWVSSGTT